MTRREYYCKRLLITGGAGYLATALIRALSDTDCHVIRIERDGVRFPPVRGAVKVEDIYLDVRQKRTWDRLIESVDFIFHFAAQTSAYVSFDEPLADLEINSLPMLYLLEACRQSRVTPNVLFAGTVTEVGITVKLPVDESHPDRPITIYDLHKWMAEQYLKQYVQAKLANGAILRLANVYGPGPRSTSADRGVLNGMIRKALNGETLTIYGEGEYMRDYVFVNDVAQAFLNAGAMLQRLNGRHFVIGSGVGHTIAEAVLLVADRVAEKTGQKTKVVHVPPPPSLLPIEYRHFVADTSSFTEATGWRPIISLMQGIDLTIDAIQAERAEA